MGVSLPVFLISILALNIVTVSLILRREREAKGGEAWRSVLRAGGTGWGKETDTETESFHSTKAWSSARNFPLKCWSFWQDGEGCTCFVVMWIVSLPFKIRKVCVCLNLEYWICVLLMISHSICYNILLMSTRPLFTPIFLIRSRDVFWSIAQFVSIWSESL